MTTHTSRACALTLAAALVLTGCRGDDDVTEAAADDADTGGAATDDPDAGDGATDGTTQADAADGTDGEPAGESATGAGDDRLGEVVVDETLTHPNGVEVTIRSLRVERDAIFVDLEAFNGAAFEVLLAALDLARVVDDTGHEYRYEPPEDNEALEIESNGTLEGSIAFVGRTPSDATSVTVHFNYKLDGEPLQPPDADNAELADAPSFEFADLPLPADDAG